MKKKGWMFEWIEYEKDEWVNELNVKRMNVNAIWKGWMCDWIKYEKDECVN